MPIVDERGRLYGRVNLIDAAVALIVLILIPAAYGSYLLFRSPTPKLTGVSPAKLYQGNQVKVEISGQDLRPFMRVSFNDTQGKSFLFNSPRSAFVDLPDLGPGTYDIVLYDYSQEVTRLPKAFTILPLSPTPVIEMEVTGAFIGVPPERRAELKKGQQFPPAGDAQVEVLAVGQPVPGQLRVRAGGDALTVPLSTSEVPATLRVRCNTISNADGSVGCAVPGPQQPGYVAPNAILTLVGSGGWLNFQIQGVHLSAVPVLTQAHARFVVTPEVLAEMKPGDSDGGAMAAGSLHEATISALGAVRVIAGAEAGPRAPLGGSLRVVDVTLRVPVDQVRGEWFYKTQLFKAGANFTFETARYVVHGEIVDMTTPAPPGQARDK